MIWTLITLKRILVGLNDKGGFEMKAVIMYDLSDPKEKMMHDAAVRVEDLARILDGAHAALLVAIHECKDKSIPLSELEEIKNSIQEEVVKNNFSDIMQHVLELEKLKWEAGCERSGLNPDGSKKSKVKKGKLKLVKEKSK